MPFVNCPDCGHAISDAATTCINCGHPMPGRPVATANPQAHAGAYTPVPSQSPGETAAGSMPFFEVSLPKFVVMSVVTFGIYNLYWTYKQWVHISARSREGISPFWRAFFSPIWSFSLFERIKVDASTRGVPVYWSPGLLGLVYLIMGVLYRLPDPYWLLSLLSFLPLVPAVRAVIAIHERSTGGATRDRNSYFGAANVIGIIVGIGFLLLIIAAMASEPQQLE